MNVKYIENYNFLGAFPFLKVIARLLIGGNRNNNSKQINGSEGLKA